VEDGELEEHLTAPSTPLTLHYARVIGYTALTVGLALVAEPLGWTRHPAVPRALAALVLTGAPLSLSVLMMLRHAGHFSPTPVAVSAGLAVAGLTAAALSLFHNHDASVWTLVWSVGTVSLFVALGGLFGSRMLTWAPR